MTVHPERLADRLQHRLAALGPTITAVGGGRFDSQDRRLVTVTVRPRRRAVRVDLAAGWPWPRRRAVRRASRGYVFWVRDELTLRAAIALVHRTLWRVNRRATAPWAGARSDGDSAC